MSAETEGISQKVGRWQTLIDVISGLMVDFLWLMDVDAGGLRPKKGPRNFTPNLVTPYGIYDITRYFDTIAAMAHIARYLFREVGNFPDSAIPPFVLSFTQAHLCDTPCSNISRDNCAIPHKNKHEIVLRLCGYKASVRGWA